MRGRWYFLGRRPPKAGGGPVLRRRPARRAGRRPKHLSPFRRFLIANGIIGKRLAHGPLSMALQAGAFPVTSLHVEKGDDAYRALINSS
jgi:hypothetical protein